MIQFFRDTLDGPLYYILAIICIFFIMAIIGFLMEKKKIEKEIQSKTAVIENKIPDSSIPPISPVTVEEEKQIPEEEQVVSNSNSEDKVIPEVVNKVIDFNETAEK